MWIVKDYLVNLFLKIRLWCYLAFYSRKFNNVKNNSKKNGWTITFEDNFDKKKLDKKKWRTDHYFGLRYHPGNIINENRAPIQYCGDNMFEFTDSTIKQKSEKNPIKINYTDLNGVNYGKFTIPYRVGHLDSSKSFEQKYGFFEIRSKMTVQPGHWPAFWMASKNSWPPEIDIYEMYTGRPVKGLVSFESNFHWGTPKNKKMKVMGHNVQNISKEFHTYAVEWNEKGFKIYYDNILIRVFSNPRAINEFKYPMHIIIGNQIDSIKERKLDEAKFPTYHEIDYVRAYKKN